MENMRCLVTGVSGFIGSNLAEQLIHDGHSVFGIDSFEDFYPRKLKEENLKSLRDSEQFRLIEGNIIDLPLETIVPDVDCVFHEAAQPGVRDSWGSRFEIYAQNNVLATQKLLEASVEANIKRFVYASSSSVYGDVDSLPIDEKSRLRPVSPYGVSKLAGENLCHLYWKNYGVPVVALRYFTVYGPRQRPDMAFNRFIKAILKGEEITIYGDGSQTRDYTYIGDIVGGTLSAVEGEVVGEVFNLGGGFRMTLNEVLDVLEEVIGKKARRVYVEVQKGDVKHTFSDITKAERMLHYTPSVSIEEGLREEVKWLKSQNQK
jgi:UDP-glucose 4-epimerase